MSLTHDDVTRILQILDGMQDRDIHIEFGDLRIDVTRGRSGTEPGTQPASAPAPVPAPPAAPASASPPPAPATAHVSAPDVPAPSAAIDIPPGMVAVRAPMVGTFYRAPSPGAAPFVEVGQAVGPDDTLFLLEVMKLFNSVKAGVAGRVSRILVENAAMVKNDQLLMLIEPD